jgi:transposase InsO family protein
MNQTVAHPVIERSLDRIIEWRGKPGTIRVDNGAEYISIKLLEWAEKQGVTIQHIIENIEPYRGCK